MQTFLYIVILKRKQINNNIENLKKYRSKIVYIIVVFIA